MKSAVWLVMVLMLAALVSAANTLEPAQVIHEEDRQVIQMRTIDFFLIQFTVTDVNGIDYRNCVPYLDIVSDQDLKKYMTFTPQIFNMKNDESQIITGRLDNVPVGYYTTDINIKCDKYFDGKIVDTGKILSPESVPQYEIFITPAGEGQTYVFIPGQSYTFVSKPGQTETASFSIANTGLIPLTVSVVPQFEYQGIVSVEPHQANIAANDRQTFKITVHVPSNFTTLSTNLTVTVGDYTENFPVNGELETIGLGGNAVAQNLFQGSISAGNIKIPVWAVVIVILVAGFALFKSEFKPKKRSRK